MLKLSSVRTPKEISNLLESTQSSLHQLRSALCEEFREHECWTDHCTSLLTSNLSSLYLYDRYEYCLGRAYGHQLYKILLNPLMIFCYHPQCLANNRAPIRLRHMYDLSYYVMHLRDHNDHIGIAMQKRFYAVSKNVFITEESLDELSPSPYSLNPIILLSDTSKTHLQLYGINRHLASKEYTETYICHWKNKLITSKIIGPSSLTFQEDEALVHSLLCFPNPVRDWSAWGTISFYCMKIYSSISAAALNLHRGLTFNRLASNQSDNINIHSFFRSINHPGPSLTTEQRNSPVLNYDNQVFHKSELIFHLKVLQKNGEVIKISFPKVTRYPVTLGIDEQEINQGTFVHNGKLLGLANQMSVDDLKNIGLKNLARHIAECNHFITCVWEYRLTDFSGFMCSNIYSSFEAGALIYERCVQQLMYAVELSKTCLSCLKNDSKCEYTQVNVQCSECVKNGDNCVSILVFHTLWDMGSAHVKTANLANQIDMHSSDSDYLSAILCTIGFGGLHLVKAIVNAMRNHILSYNGENYGMNIFRSVKQDSGLLDTIKQAVFVGKDRQSDYLSFMSTCKSVQDALEKSKNYQLVCVPEPVLHYTENAKSQKEIILPTALATNQNGDIFVLDRGASCIHAIDRCVVSRGFLIGSYKAPSMEKYPMSGEVSAAKAKFSNQLTDMIAVDNDLYVSDCKRKEIVIVRNVITAKVANTCRIQVLSVDNCLSLAHVSKYLLILQQFEFDQKIQLLSVSFPPKKSRIEINTATFKMVVSITITNHKMRSLFTVNDSIFGAIDKSSHVCFYTFSGKKVALQERTCVTSEIKPCSNKHGQLLTLSSGEIITHGTCIKNDLFIIDNVVEKRTLANVYCFYQWGEVLYVSRLVNINRYVLQEFGPLNFGLSLCKAVNRFYDSISYVEPGAGGDLKMQLNLKECIAMATPFVNLLTKMQESREGRYSGRKSFSGEFGIPFSKTIECIVHTIDSWKALEKRLDFFKSGLADSLYSHSVTSESWVEHSFGFTSKRGQGNLQSIEEYVQAKRKHAMDFQMRMCDAPFCQKVKTKVRDKGYQNIIDNRKIKLSIQEISEIFKELQQTHEHQQEVSEEEKLFLRKAYLLSKSVPRQTNRTKWRERSGYQPNLLVEAPSKVGKLIESVQT